MGSCIFCEIVAGRVKSDRVYEDDQVVAFHDVNPQAPVHILIIPREHVPSVMDVPGEKLPMVGALHAAAQKIVRRDGLDRTGFRLVVNNGPDAGQAVSHLHVHLLAGRRLGWPPG